MTVDKTIGRREFLKILGAQVAAALAPMWVEPSLFGRRHARLSLSGYELPKSVQSILQCVPRIKLDEAGYAVLVDDHDRLVSRVLVRQTQWNRERNNRFERLFDHLPWGIVLHWFGATFKGAGCLESYLRGFDGIRTRGDFQTKTSAHFLVGGGGISSQQDQVDEVGIVQTQLPDVDGTPFVGSHLFTLDLEAHRERRQYFVRAWYQLGYQYPGVHSILTDFYDGPFWDPNYRTIAVELTGADFDQPSSIPGKQQIANTVALVCALMKRYQIPIQNILGHHEIELRKPDPGKVFMNWIRFLIGVQALVSQDEELQHLVFGAFQQNHSDPWQAVYTYFRFIRDYIILVALPDQVFDWEQKTNYWLLENTILGNLSEEVRPKKLHFFDQMILPVKEKVSAKKDGFLQPENHSGVDLYLAENPTPFTGSNPVGVYLPATGECLYFGRAAVCGYGFTAVFRHYQMDGAAILTLYSHLHQIAEMKLGNFYPQGYRLGEFERGTPLGEGYLHFAVAYGATWENTLGNSPVLSPQINQDWISRRFLSPLDYINRWKSYPEVIHHAR